MARKSPRLLIVERMERHRLTVPELARLTGAAERTVTNWRSGREPEEKYRRKLAEVLGGRPSDYVYNSGGRGSPPEVKRLETLARRLERDLAELRAEIQRLRRG